MSFSGGDGRSKPGESNLYSLHSLRVQLQEMLSEFETRTGLMVSEVSLARRFERGVAVAGRIHVVRVRAEVVTEDFPDMEDDEEDESDE